MKEGIVVARVPRYICDVCGSEEPLSSNSYPVHSSFNIGGYGRKFEDTCPRCSYVLNEVLDKLINALQERQKRGENHGVRVTIELEPDAANKVELKF